MEGARFETSVPLGPESGGLQAEAIEEGSSEKRFLFTRTSGFEARFLHQ